ncbi:MAG: hypothetical protein N2170_01075 [Bacteroidia bacterium]|nr:hypothetical protein [Bacteroidia bacterium]
MSWGWILPLYVWLQGGVAIGQWGVYSYHGNIRSVTYISPYFWCLSTEGVVVVDGETGSYRELHRGTGLLYNRPTALYGDPYAGWIFLGYDDGQIQYGESPEALSVLREIAVNPIYTARAIRDLHAKGDTLAIATDFGLVLWSKRQRRVLATVAQFPGIAFAEPVSRVRWANGRLWVVTSRGLFSLSEGRPWSGPWEKVSGTGYGLPDSMQYFGGWVETPQDFLLLFRDSLYRWSGNRWELYPLPPPFQGRRVLCVGGEGGGWALSAADVENVHFFTVRGETTYMWNPGATALWMSPTGSYRAVGSGWIGAFLASPKISVSTDAHQRLRAGGVTEVLPTPTGIFFLHGGSGFWGAGWSTDVTFYPHGAPKGNLLSLSLLSGRYSPGLTEAVWDGAHAWIASSSAIMKITPSGRVDTFTAYNAPFDGIFPDPNGKPSYMAFSSLAVDKNGAIWAVKRYGNRNICVYLPYRGAWECLPYGDGAEAILVRVDSRGYKWVLFVNGRIRVIDDRGQPENVAVHRSVVLGVGGQPLPGLPSSRITTLAPDRTGAVWLGTDRGVAVLYGDPFDGSLSLSVPVIENRYALEEESITDVAVDGQNRKWIGTQASGVYVLSSDGSRQIANFNTQNSPLPSDLIYRIRPWDSTGEVFMITADGTVSYRDWATEPSERLDTLHIFPNPVSRTFEGWIGIRGLSEGSTVRIFTPDGQQVRYLQSFGGQAVWDLRTITGEKVAPGFYLIGAIDREGQRSAVGKIVVTE